MSRWWDTTLGEVCELKRGYDLPASLRALGVIPVVSSSGITGYHSVAKVKGPGVVTGRYGTLGAVYYLDSDFWPLNTSLYVRDFKGNDPRFVAALLKSLNLADSGAAAAVPGVNRNHLHMLPVRCPDLDTQRAVGHLLGSIDGLIGNSTRRITILEALTRALYREWFVEFRYPGHEGVPLVDSEMGPIPKGWVVTAASDALEVNPRLRIPASTESPFVAMGDLSEEYAVCFPSTIRGGNSGSRFQKHDTLFARITPCLENGKTGYLLGLGDAEIARGSTEFIVLRGRRVGSAFTYCLARSDAFRSNAIQSMSGASGRQRVRTGCLDSFPVAIPPTDVQGRFEEVARGTLRLQYELAVQSRRLVSARDLLLPRLVSGQIDVSNVELAEVV